MTFILNNIINLRIECFSNGTEDLGAALDDWLGVFEKNK